jgi:glutathione-regulated potassium-efflux system ancillary protein KefC
MSGRSALELMGWQRHTARTQAMRFRRHSVELLEQMRPHSSDESQLIAIAKQGRQQLEELWAQERREGARTRGVWHAPDVGGEDADQGP